MKTRILALFTMAFFAITAIQAQHIRMPREHKEWRQHTQTPEHWKQHANPEARQHRLQHRRKACVRKRDHHQRMHRQQHFQHRRNNMLRERHQRHKAQPWIGR